MAEIAFITVKSELPDNEFDSLTENSTIEKSEVPNEEDYANTDFVGIDHACHSIFGTDTPDWTKTKIKIESDEFGEKEDTKLDKNKLEPEVNIKEQTASSSSFNSIQSIPNISNQHNSTLKPKIKCELCFFTTINRGNLKQHMKKHEHPQQRVYECEICEFKTKYKNSMKGHNERHENVKGGKRSAPYSKRK